MTLGLSYMGTKHALAPAIAEVISSARAGPVLDGFSGMCAVGQAVGTKRQVWSNDIQVFASTIARLLFSCPDHPPRVGAAADLLYDDFQRNQSALATRYARLLKLEQEALENRSLAQVVNVGRSSRRLLWSANEELASVRRVPRSFPCRLFTLYYSGTYFGISQCIEIDSIVFAVYEAVRRRKLTGGQRAWLLVGLARAMQRSATTTGHFAQFLVAKSGTLSRFVQQRRRSIWKEWLADIPISGPIGDWDWRAKNKVFRRDTLALVGSMKSVDSPAVVYADPPYTEDHYSRYYHLLETLIRYDYPIVSGKARYRAGRFHTPFSIKSKVKTAFEKLAVSTAALRAELVLSYPNNGLLSELNLTAYSVIRPFFRSVEVCRRISHDHSTLGASKGPASHSVTETIYWARP